MKYGVKNAEKLLVKREELEDYYVLTYDDTRNDTSAFFVCMLCNDKTNRILEISYRNKNVLPDKKHTE